MKMVYRNVNAITMAKTEEFSISNQIRQETKTSMWHLVTKENYQQGAVDNYRPGRARNNHKKKKMEVDWIRTRKPESNTERLALDWKPQSARCRGSSDR